jgi:hypothetical protein
MIPVGRGKRESWTAFLSLLGSGWEKSARTHGAFTRRRKIRTPGRLLKAILIYLTGYASRTTVVLAGLSGAGRFSETAFLKRLRQASSWLHELAVGLMKQAIPEWSKPAWLQRFNVRCIDATVVCQPGSKGTDWRLHFSYGLFSLSFDQFRIDGHQLIESFCNFAVQAGDLLIGDRGYARLNGLRHVLQQHGDFIVRLGRRSLALYDLLLSQRLDLLQELAHLHVGEVLDRWVIGRDRQGDLRLRICACRLPRHEARRAQRAALKNAKRKQQRIHRETLRWYRYVILVTSVSEAQLSAEQVLALYRLRWQIEIAIKRLKSVIGLSELPCRNKESCRAWLYGKLLLALLVQSLINQGREPRFEVTESKGSQAESKKRGGNLWRETCVMLILVEAVTIWGIRFRQFLRLWRRISQRLAERTRKRLPQHELLLP